MIEMSKCGRYHRVRVLVNGHKPCIAVCDSREEAEDVEIAYYAATKIDAGETLGAFGQKELERRERGQEVRDTGTDWSRWDTHIAADPIATVCLGELARVDVLEWLERMQSKRSARGKLLAQQTVRNTLNLLRVVLRAAVDKEVLKSNPALDVRLKRRAKRADEPWTYLTLAEQRRLVTAAGKDGTLVAFALGTGLRAGELCALRRRDVVLGGRDPHVFVRYGGPPHEPTKTGRTRKVPLLGPGLEAARAAMRAKPKTNPHGLLFPRSQGGYRDPAHVIRWDTWKAVVAKAKLGRPLRWHDLRHTCASSLASGWWGRRWSLDEVQHVLGHTERSTTERYAHLCESAIAEAARETRAECPQGARMLSARNGKKVMVSMAPPAGIGPATNGLGSPRSPERSRNVTDPAGSARAFLEACGQWEADEAKRCARELVGAVLQDEAVMLALSVARGGPFAMNHAARLATLTLERLGELDSDDAAAEA